MHRWAKPILKQFESTTIAWCRYTIYFETSHSQVFNMLHAACIYNAGIYRPSFRDCSMRRCMHDGWNECIISVSLLYMHYIIRGSAWGHAPSGNLFFRLSAWDIASSWCVFWLLFLTRHTHSYGEERGRLQVTIFDWFTYTNASTSIGGYSGLYAVLHLIVTAWWCSN